jgi:luciferase family oxidoreductase group 1
VNHVSSSLVDGAAAVIPLSLLDLVPLNRGESVTEAMRHAVDLARVAEREGYARVWYAEHHNQFGAASSATAVVIGHVANSTSTIRVGSGGIMLPNHSPLAVAEQFGTLDALHPGRIDLGLGRSSGGGGSTQFALRRSPEAAERFADDVEELRSFLGGSTAVPGVWATPGRNSEVPITILGSSISGARTAARLGTRFAYAAHISPDSLDDAVAVYRSEFVPSAWQAQPHLMITALVFAADDKAEAEQHRRAMLRFELRKFLMQGDRDVVIRDGELDNILDSAQGIRLTRMFHHSAVGTAAEVDRTLRALVDRTDADELILAHQAPDPAARVRSVELTKAPLRLAHFGGGRDHPQTKQLGAPTT